MILREKWVVCSPDTAALDFLHRLSLWAASESCFGSAHRAGKQRLGGSVAEAWVPREVRAL